MRSFLVIVAVVVSATLTASPILAQEEPPLSSAEIAAACAAPVADTRAPHALRIIGAQTISPRSAYDGLDLLIINGGTSDGVQLGTRFFVRRALQFGSGQLIGAPVNIVTGGWIRIVAVNATTAIARVERSCGAIFRDDYLEPYAAPELPAGSASAGEPDFDSLARIVSGPEGHDTAVPGEFIIVDHGSEDGVQPGTRIAVYRDLSNAGRYLSARPGVPLAVVGDAIVVSVSGSQARARILESHDAVRIGDYAVFRR